MEVGSTGLSPPPIFSVRSPPPVATTVPSASTRPVEATARSSPVGPLPVTPALRPAITVRLPPPRVPIPWKPVMVLSTFQPEVRVKAPKLIHHAVGSVDTPPPWRQSQLPVRSEST